MVQPGIWSMGTVSRLEVHWLGRHACGHIDVRVHFLIVNGIDGTEVVAGRLCHQEQAVRGWGGGKLPTTNMGGKQSAGPFLHSLMPRYKGHRDSGIEGK